MIAVKRVYDIKTADLIVWHTLADSNQRPVFVEISDYELAKEIIVDLKINSDQITEYLSNNNKGASPKSSIENLKFSQIPVKLFLFEDHPNHINEKHKGDNFFGGRYMLQTEAMREYVEEESYYHGGFDYFAKCSPVKNGRDYHSEIEVEIITKEFKSTFSNNDGRAKNEQIFKILKNWDRISRDKFNEIYANYSS